MKNLAELKRTRVGDIFTLDWAKYHHKYLGIPRKVTFVQSNALCFEGGSRLTFPEASEFKGAPDGFTILESNGEEILSYKLVSRVEDSQADETSDYDKQAEKFLRETGTMFSTDLIRHGKYFPDDKQTRNVYWITLFRTGVGAYSFEFGQSRAEQSNEPTAYDVLACLEAYEPYNPQGLEGFLSDYGLSYNRESVKMFEHIGLEHEGLTRLYNETEMELLREIQ